jgi:hypothetical protein
MTAIHVTTWDETGDPGVDAGDLVELRVPGYYPHTRQPAAVNAALRELWAHS